MTTPAGGIILFSTCTTCSQASVRARRTPLPSPSTAKRPGALKTVRVSMSTYFRKA